MLRLWRWAFARLYIRQKRSWGTEWDGYISAAFLLGLAISSNLLALTAAGIEVLGGPAGGLLVAHKAHLAAGSLLVVAVVYRQYVMKGSAAELIDRFSRQSRAKTRREERKLWCYLIGSILLPFLVAAVAKLLRGP